MIIKDSLLNSGKHPVESSSLMEGHQTSYPERGLYSSLSNFDGFVLLQELYERSILAILESAAADALQGRDLID
jgi:hypothetical protein